LNREETLSSCDLCGSEDLEALFPKAKLQQCRACSFLFHNPRPTDEAIFEFYSQQGKYAHWLDEISGRTRMWEARLRLLQSYLPEGKLLDVGAGIGQFLAQARDTGHFQVFGTEVSEEAVQIARERYQLELHQGTLEEVALEEASFDGVCLFHVLEHVPFPRRTLERCARLLRPGGRLVVAVPNDSALHRYKEFYKGWNALGKVFAGSLGDGEYAQVPAFPEIKLREAEPDEEIHLSHFHEASLVEALEQSGFEVQYRGLDPAYPSEGWARWRDNLKFSFWSLVRRLLRRNLYGTLLMVGRLP
jgi:2-polyprenyl-3-methyl-5-hydroxy-6-metoxy-1,4-benzoquinol methylase